MTKDEAREKAREWLSQIAGDPPGVRFVSGPIIMDVDSLTDLLLRVAEQAEAELERVRVGWKEAGHRCPQCGTPNRNLEKAEAELERLRGVLRRVLSSTPHSMCADAEAWAKAESALDGEKRE